MKGQKSKFERSGSIRLIGSLFSLGPLSFLPLGLPGVRVSFSGCEKYFSENKRRKIAHRKEDHKITR
jgi:hypothetical protein